MVVFARKMGVFTPAIKNDRVKFMRFNAAGPEIYSRPENPRKCSRTRQCQSPSEVLCNFFGRGFLTY